MARGMAGRQRGSGTAGTSGSAGNTGKVGKTRPVSYQGNTLTLPSPSRQSTSRTASSPATQTGSNLGSTSTGTYAGYSAGGGFDPSGALAAPVAPVPAPEPVKKAPSLEEYLGSDSIYTTQKAALENALKNFGLDVGSYNDKGEWVQGQQGQNYHADYDRNLKDLGWTEDGWNQNDRLTSYGSSYGNQIDDFATRGMLESSAYQEALNNLLRGFTDQKSGMDSSRDAFVKGLQGQFNTARDDTAAQLKQAQAEAALRRASEYQL